MSQPCTHEQLASPEFREWADRLKIGFKLHRKLWEYCYITQSLFERGLLAPGAKGLGFGVGKEPLPELFASYGCTIVATDAETTTARAAGWGDNQHAEDTTTLLRQGLCSDAEFNRLVSFRHVDMNAIPDDLGGFDFVWSSCSFEHLGSIDRGLEFVERAMGCLRAGGVAVHTTEYNVSSNFWTIKKGGTVLYRKRDIERLAKRLKSAGHSIELDFTLGDDDVDRYVDLPPYEQNVHLKLQIEKWVSTSLGLIIRKA